MEEEISRMKFFLNDYNNEQIQSPTSEEIAHTRIGNYALEPEDVTGQVIDWVLNYLENRKCPYSLAVSIAKEIAQQISVSGILEKTCNASDIYSEAIGKIPSVCNAFANQANLESICSRKYTTSTFAIKNKRRKMEDRHVIHHDLNALLDLKDAPYQSYYAVFDGHSGIDAACYASALLHMNIAKHPEFLTDTAKAIIEGYQITDLNFLNKCNKWNIKSGSTAVCAFIRNNTVFLSWLGDSQGVLVKGGFPVIITSPHKPDREDERHRIEKLGGHVSHMGTWRVNGLLAVTRALGDPDQKPFISSEPELEVINLDGTEDFLILACDGLWDGISPEDATGILYRYVVDSSPDEPPEAFAAKLVHQSKLQGSEDNITTIVVFLRDIKDIKKNAVEFLSNPLHCAQSHDFMAVNGNMKMFTMDPNYDTSFSKPTVLELNAASSKKLKNAANVMSSAGFGSASYSYQYVENATDGPFQTVSPSVVDSAQAVYVPQTAHTASCFAPEATALSELPTPPIDDILASQQFENFYSTDLYKELNNSVQALQDSQLVDVNNITDTISGSNEPLSPSVDVSSQPVCDTAADVSNMSLLDEEENSGTDSGTILSPHDAVGIASTVVSSTIETAVKCLSDETQEPPSVQSPIKLNPYAKPFVMKSFFNPEASDSMSNSFIGSGLDEASSPCEGYVTKLDSQIIAEVTSESAVDKTLSDDVEHNPISNMVMDQSFTDSLNSDHAIELDQSALSENVSDKLPVEFDNNLSVIENELPKQSVNEPAAENMPNEPLQNVTSRDFLEGPEKTKSDIIHEPISFQKSEISFTENVNIINQEAALAENSDGTDFLSATFENVNLHSDFNVVGENIPASSMNTSAMDENKNVDQSPVSSECLVSPSKIPDQESVTKSTTQSATCLEESMSEQNQNLKNISVDLTSENATSVTTEFESKHDVIESIKITETCVTSESFESIEKDKLYFTENVDITNQVASQPEISDATDFLREKFENVNLHSDFNVVGENIPASSMDTSAMDENKNIDQSPVSSECLVSPNKIPNQITVSESITQSASFQESILEQNQNSKNISLGLTSEDATSVVTEFESRYIIESTEISESFESVEKESMSLVNVDADQSQVKTIKQDLVIEPTAESFEDSAKPEPNQNHNTGNVSKGLTSDIIEAEIKSKCEEIQKSIVDAVEKSEHSEPSSLVEQISLINIKDELIPTESEVPSDPSAEDSRIDSVAVDLKSLPEGIPEAEGVTEDIDSDSEKDGGWSYMKGNTVAGSKSKPVEKIIKTSKSGDVKSTVTSKTKRDVSKPVLDLKSKVRNVTADKTKSTLMDKSKSVSIDKTKNAVADKAKSVASVDKTKTPTSVDKTKTPISMDKTKSLTSVDKNRSLTSVDKTKSLTSVDKNKSLTSIDKTKTLSPADRTKRVPIERKPDVKTRVLKSSTLSTTTKVTADKTNKVTTVSSIKKEVNETNKTTSTVAKSTRPATLMRISTAANKPVSSTVVTDRSAASNKPAAKPRVTSLLENKSNVRSTTSPNMSKRPTTVQSKSSTVSTRSTLTRPATTVPTKTAKPTLQKSAVSELKPKLLSSASATTMKKPIAATAKKTDVKEVKDNVNKQILAKKTVSASRIESTSTLGNRRVAPANNKSASSKVSSVAKLEVGKKNVPKASTLKTVSKNPGSKISQDACKSKEKIVETIQCKTDETKNNLNIESDQKNVTEIVQVAEEKFILETSDKEKAKGIEEISNEEPVIVENGSLSKPITPTPDDVKVSAAECTSENL